MKVAALPEPAVLAPTPKARSRASSSPRKAEGSSPLDGDALFEERFGNAESDEGHCIRCGDDIDFDPGKPLCRDCYGVWKRYGDPDYKEDYCHSCGDESDTSVAKPLCYDCYRD